MWTNKSTMLSSIQPTYENRFVKQMEENKNDGDSIKKRLQKTEKVVGNKN